ncbi:MAG: hypothetical protein ABL977_11080 [Candidatus Eisenbacteria bacterium]
MADAIDWEATSWEGQRRLQHQEFRALSFRDKLLIIEQLDEVADFFSERRRASGLPVRSSRRAAVDRTAEPREPS